MISTCCGFDDIIADPINVKPHIKFNENALC